MIGHILHMITMISHRALSGSNQSINSGDIMIGKASAMAAKRPRAQNLLPPRRIGDFLVPSLLFFSYRFITNIRCLFSFLFFFVCLFGRSLIHFLIPLFVCYSFSAILLFFDILSVQLFLSLEGGRILNFLLNFLTPFSSSSFSSLFFLFFI